MNSIPNNDNPEKPAIWSSYLQETSTGTLRSFTPYGMHHTGNGRRFVSQHSDSVRYCAERGVWLVWDENKWIDDTAGYTHEMAKKVGHAIEEEAVSEPDKDLKADLFAWAVESQMMAGINNMLKAAESDSRVLVKIDELDADDYLFNALDCTINLRTGETYSPRGEDLITKQGGANYTFVAPMHPVVKDFLETKIPNDSDRLWLQKYCGSLLAGSTSLESLLFLYGETGGGKTTLIEAMAAVMGSYAGGMSVSTILKQSRGNQTFDLAAMLGLRLVHCSEIGADKKLDVERLKMLSGGDTIPQAARKYEHPFDFKARMKLVFAANDRPFAPDDDDAFWARMKQFPMVIKDAGFRAQLANDEELTPWKQTFTTDQSAMDSFFTWMVDGWFLLQAEGLGTCDAVQQATEEYRKEMNPVMVFTETLLTFHPNSVVSKSQLWQIFKAWQSDQGIRFGLKQRDFNRRIRALPGVVESQQRHDGKMATVRTGMMLDEAAVSEIGGALLWS